MEARRSRWEPSNRVDGRSTAFFLARNPALSGGPQELAPGRLSERAGDCTGMNKRLMRIGLWLWLAAVFTLRSLADVSVTEPTGANDVSADKSLNSTNGAGFVA